MTLIFRLQVWWFRYSTGLKPGKVQSRGKDGVSWQARGCARAPLCRASWWLGSPGSLPLRVLLPIPPPLGTARTFFLLLESCHKVF